MLLIPLNRTILVHNLKAVLIPGEVHCHSPTQPWLCSTPWGPCQGTHRRIMSNPGRFFPEMVLKAQEFPPQKEIFSLAESVDDCCRGDRGRCDTRSHPQLMRTTLPRKQPLRQLWWANGAETKGVFKVGAGTL